MPSIQTALASAPPLYAYAFKRVSGDATLTGFFVDDACVQIPGALESFTISSTAITLTTLYANAHSSAPLPTGAVGFLGVLSASVYVGLGGASDGTISTSPDMRPGSGYPQLGTGVNIGLGRVPR